MDKILNETGFSNIWQTQTFKSIEWLKQSIKQTCQTSFYRIGIRQSIIPLKHLIIEFSKLILNLKNILIFQMNKIPFFYVNLELQIINCPQKREDGVIFRGKSAIANFVKRIKLETNIITYLNVLIKAKNVLHYFQNI